MNYRPLTDFWFLTRAKLKSGVKYYGAYLGGFPERARVLIGCSLREPLLHVCGGMAHLYPYNRGFGSTDCTMDLNSECNPTFCMDCREEDWPMQSPHGEYWCGILIDPPYSEVDAEHYPPGREKYPNPNRLVQTAINSLHLHYKVGIIHYVVPRCPENAKFVACVGIVCGFGNRVRCFSVFERIK